MTRRLVILTALVTVATTAFTLLGFWQLDRLRERRAEIALIEERLGAPPVAYSGVEEPYRHVTVTGRYRTTSVLLRNRTYEGQNGLHVLTPLTYDGGVVLVDRGWIPRGVDPPEPPPETVTVDGVVRRSQTPSRIGPKDPESGPLDEVYWVDLERLSPVFGVDLGDRYIELRSEEPTVEPSPIPSTDPTLDEGPHLSYAVQWFAFAGIALAGYVVLLRRKPRHEQAIG